MFFLVLLIVGTALMFLRNDGSEKDDTHTMLPNQEARRPVPGRPSRTRTASNLTPQHGSLREPYSAPMLSHETPLTSPRADSKLSNFSYISSQATSMVFGDGRSAVQSTLA